jgi:hypothetical protein
VASMLDEAARWNDLVVGLRPMSYGAKGVLARCLVSIGPTTTAKASSEGWRLRLRPNSETLAIHLGSEYGSDQPRLEGNRDSCVKMRHLCRV